MIRRILVGRGDDEAAEPGENQTRWEEAALREAPFAWVLVDPRLFVVALSDAAATLFHSSPNPPLSFIALTRSPALEDHARSVLAQGSGEWEERIAHYGLTVRMSGVRLEDGGAILFMEDLTELRRLEAIRAEFVANLAHELRTPVTSLRLAVETLRSGPGAADAQVFMQRVVEETAYITGMLQTLTELAAIEGGDITMHREVFGLRTEADETWRRVSANRPSQVTLRNRVDQLLQVNADRAKVAEVLQNLFDNAIRHSPPQGTITVEAERAGAEIVCAVLDEGPGIAPDDLERVFQRFYKSEASRTRGERGSGLGLAIAKHLVAAHGGRIWAEPGPQGGAGLRFTLPASGGLS